MNTDFLIIPFIINLILFAYVKYNYSDYLKLVLYSTINYQSSILLWKENKNNKPRSFYILLVIFFISIGVFSLILFQKFYPEFFLKHFWLIIPTTLFFVALLISFNKIANYISGKIFLQDEISSEYNNNINSFNQSFGIFLFPLTILMTYTKSVDLFIYIGISFFAIIYLLKIIRLFKINISKQLNILYMFLYLCTLEIIPMLYIAKLFVLI